MTAKQKARTSNNLGQDPDAPRVRNHKFESFTQRIARLKIDPLRRNRKEELGGNDAQSHFQNALQYWRESNLSDSFSGFVSEIEGLYDSLPQVLHHKAKLVEILINYIEKRDVLSLEPLLNLTSCLAHDLGVRFEDHFPAILELVLDVAAKHKDVEAVEWSFSCLAWLFKYLSSLLVPDLRPTYDLVAKALGKENHKPFIARFAAESLSFLIRKSASIYSKDPEPLNRIVTHIFKDFDSLDSTNKHVDVYRYGIMSLFSNAVKGVDSGFHTTATTIFHSLLLSISSQGSEDIVIGILTNCLHHGNADTVGTITQVFYDHVDTVIMNSDEQAFELSLGLLLTLAAVRRGSRIHNWTPIFVRLGKLADFTSKTESIDERRSLMLARTAAVVFTTATEESCLANVRLVNNLSQRLDAQAFLSLCLSIAELNRDRFSQFLLPLFYNLIMLTENIKQDVVLFTALHLIDSGVELVQERRPTTSYQMYLEEGCRPTSVTEECISRSAGIIEFLSSIKLTQEIRQSFANRLVTSIKQEQNLDKTQFIKNPLMALYLGPALRFTITSASMPPSLRQVIDAMPALSSVPVYLQNLNRILSDPRIKVEDDLSMNVIDEVAKNLPSPSKALRTSSLELLQTYYERCEGSTAVVLDTALQLEQLALDIKSARTASMYVRRLLEQYQSLPERSWLIKVIPLYCFGLLHFKLGQVRIEGLEALKQMSSSAVASTVIADVVFGWLNDVQQTEHVSSKVTEVQKTKYNEFQCSTMDKFSRTLTQSELNLDNATQGLKDRYSQANSPHTRTSVHCHAYALEVLKNLPGLAEKKSRHLVPIFLRLAEADRVELEQDGVDAEIDEKDGGDVVTQSRALSRREQLGFLEIFGLFTNPKMLHRASEVHTELLRYLSNGDGAIQKAALKALSTWKLTSLERYMESFTNLLDDTRFREEITVVINGDNAVRDADLKEVLPVLLRLLYGRAISKTGSTGSKGSLTSKRRAVFDALARLGTEAIQDFTKIALGPLADSLWDGIQAPSEDALVHLPSQRQQLGFLNLTKDMVESLGDKAEPAFPSIISAILVCGQASSVLEHEVASPTAKNIRKTCLQCLTSISSRTFSTGLPDFLPGIFKVFISPRLKNLASESSQSVSAILQLFAVWASSSDKCLWLGTYNAELLNAITDILITPAVKDTVMLFVIDEIMKPIARFANPTEDLRGTRIKEDLLNPNISFILERIGVLLESHPQRQIMSATLSLLSNLAESVEHATNIKLLVHLSVSLLSQPATNVPPRSKGDILGYLLRFVPLSGLHGADDLLGELENVLLPLLMYFTDRHNRTLLTHVLCQVALLDTVLTEPARICSLLDAYSATSLDEPDFDSRLQAFREIESQGLNFSTNQWKPLLFSLLFHVQDTEELIIRSSASTSLKNFVAVATDSSQTETMEMQRMVDTVLLPALRRGAANRSELVRLEYLSIFAETIKRFPSWEKVNDLSPLLVDDDAEASFFNNILHIQQHRRLRALRRLATEASKGNLHSNNIAHFLIPLLEHFILDPTMDKSEHNVAFETIITLSKLTLGLEWPQFRAMFRRYTNYMLTNPELEKPAIRLLTMMTDTLSQANQSVDNDTHDMTMHIDSSTNKEAPSRLCLTLPKGEKLSEDIAKHLSAPLRQYVHHKDETLVSQRVPVAVTVAKLIMLLSDDQVVQQLPPLLTDVCQILRSRVQESRDLARKTLMDISRTVGPPYIGFILKELRAALPRGYQLHVLSFTTHMLLVTNEANIENGELDYCLPDIVNIIMDDMCGITGQEKDAEGYVSQMRELKTNKSYDSMEIIARVSSLDKINTLLQPIMALLEERLDLRMLKKIDELLRRIGVGLLRNSAIQSQAALVLCFELLKEVFSNDRSASDRPVKDHRRQRFLINMRSVKKSEISHATTSATHKIARFAFDLLRTIFSRQESLQTPANVLGFMPSIGEGVMSSHEEVQVSVFRLLATIIRVPLEQLDKNAPVYVSEALNLIRNAATTSSESSQAALKLITVFLRDRNNAVVKDTDISYVLKKVKSDLDEPDRQGITFNFLKAVLHRKVIVAETYELMDTIAAMMIQNQLSSARNAARGLYVQFLVNYPQGKDRHKKQWTFLIKNLGYDFESGRQSVLETIHSLLGKVGQSVVQDIINNFFAPLVLATVNDESMGCRKMSAILLKEFFVQSTDDTQDKMLDLLRNWMTQDDQPMLTRIGLQTFTLCIESAPAKAVRDIPMVIAKIESLLAAAVPADAATEWELVYYSLQLISKAVPTFPARLLSKDCAGLLELIVLRSLYPHAWVKSVASKVLGLYFADFASAQAEQEEITLPLIGSRGLRLNMESMVTVTRGSLNALKTTGINEEFANQLVQNTVFLGRLFSTISINRPNIDGHVQIGADNGTSSEDEGEDEDTDEDGGDNAEQDPALINPLSFIFARISTVLRKDAIGNRAPSMIPKTACLRILSALCEILPPEVISVHSQSILMPLHIVTDPSTSVPFSIDDGFKTAHADMISSAQELLALIQGKLGTSEFMQKLNQVRQQIKIKRDDRKIKRRIEAVTDPERTGLKRSKKRTQQREQRKSKNSAYRAQRRGW